VLAAHEFKNSHVETRHLEQKRADLRSFYGKMNPGNLGDEQQFKRTEGRLELRIG
jgi:hypothetical protein